MKKSIFSLGLALLAGSTALQAEIQWEALNPKYANDATQFKFIDPSLVDADAGFLTIDGTKLYHIENQIGGGISYIIADIPGNNGTYYGYAFVDENTVKPYWGYVKHQNGDSTEIAIYPEAKLKTDKVKYPTGKYYINGVTVVFNGTTATATDTDKGTKYIPQEYGGRSTRTEYDKRIGDWVQKQGREVMLGGYNVSYNGNMSAAYTVTKDANGDYYLKLKGKPNVSVSMNYVNDGSQAPQFMAQDMRSNPKVKGVKNTVSHYLAKSATELEEVRINPNLITKDAMVVYADTTRNVMYGKGKNTSDNLFKIDLSEAGSAVRAKRLANINARYKHIGTELARELEKYPFAYVYDINPIDLTAKVIVVADSHAYRGEVGPAENNAKTVSLVDNTDQVKVTVLNLTEDGAYTERAAKIVANDNRIKAAEKSGKVEQELVKQYLKEYKNIEKPGDFANYFGYIKALRKQDGILAMQDKYISMLFPGDANKIAITPYTKDVEKNAKKGDVNAMVAMADALYYGYGHKQDTKKAIELYKAAVEKGSPKAYMQYAKYLSSEDVVDAYSYFDKALKSNQLTPAETDYVCGEMTKILLTLGRMEEALPLYKKTTDRQAHFEMSVEWVGKNRSLEGFETIIEEGSPEMNYINGYIKYIDGDTEGATEDFKKAAIEGLPEALGLFTDYIDLNYELNPDNYLAKYNYWQKHKPTRKISDLNSTHAQVVYWSDLKPYVFAMHDLADIGYKPAMEALFKLSAEVDEQFDPKKNPEANEFCKKDIVKLISAGYYTNLKKKYYNE